MVMKFTNNATSTLASGITNSATSLSVASGQGALFPSLSAGDYFYCTLANVSGTIEIVKVTARSTDTFTITRAQDGTTASAWNSGDKVELRLVAASLNDIPKLDENNTFSGTMTSTYSITGSNPAGAYSYGTLGYSDVNMFVSYSSSVNTYNQVIIQNTNSGTAASTDYVVSNNLGTASTYYGDFGMNSSGFSGTGSLGAANVVYLTSTSVDLSIGTTTANAIHFVIGGSATDAMLINTNGIVAIPSTTYAPTQTLTDASTVAWDTSLGQVAVFTFVSSNRTVGAPTNLKNGAFYALEVIQNSGSNTLSWNSVFKWNGATAPTLSTAAGAKDFFVFRSDGTNLYEQGRTLGVA